MRKPQQQKQNFRRQQQQQQQNSSSWETGHHTIHYEDDDDDNTDVQQHHTTAPTLCMPAPRNRTAAKHPHQRNDQRENIKSARGKETADVRLAPPPPRPKQQVHPSQKQRQQHRRREDKYDSGDNNNGHSAPSSSTSATATASSSSVLPPSSSSSSDTPAAAEQLQSLFATMSLDEQQKLLASLQSQQLQQKAERLRQEAEELERQANLMRQQQQPPPPQQNTHQQRQAKPAPLLPDPQDPPSPPPVRSQPQHQQQQQQQQKQQGQAQRGNTTAAASSSASLAPPPQSEQQQQHQPPKKFIDRNTRSELLKFVQKSKRMNGMYEKWNAIDELDEEIRAKKSPPEIKEIKKLHARAPAIQYDKWCYLFEVRERVKHLTGNSFLRELSKIFDELDELYSLRRAVFGLDDNNNNNNNTREHNDSRGSQEMPASKNQHTNEKKSPQEQEPSSTNNSNSNNNDNNENTAAPQDPWSYFKKYDSGFFCCKEMQQLRKLFDQIAEEQQQHSGQHRKKERVNDDDDDDAEHPTFNLVNEIGKLKNIYTVNSIDSLNMAGKKTFLRQHIAEIENQYSTKLKVEVKKEKEPNHNIQNINDNSNNIIIESQQQLRDQDQLVLHEHQSSTAAAASADTTTQPESRFEETSEAKTEITPPHQTDNDNDSAKKRDDDVNDDDDDVNDDEDDKPSNQTSSQAARNDDPVLTTMPSDPLHYIEQHDYELCSSDELKDLKTVFHRVTQYQKKHKKVTTKKFKQHEEVERLFKEYVENDVPRKSLDDKKQFLEDFIEDIEKAYLPPPTAEELEIKRRKKQQRINAENDIQRETQAASEQVARNEVERCEEEERVQYLQEYFTDNIRPELERRTVREQEYEKQRRDLRRQQQDERRRIEEDEMTSRQPMADTLVSYHDECQRIRAEEELNSIGWIPADVKPDFSHDASDDLEDDIRHHATRHPRVDERHCIRILSHCEANVDGCFFTERDGYGKKFRQLLFRCESLPDVVGLEEVGCRIPKLEDFMTRLGYGFYELMTSLPRSRRTSDGGVYLFYLKKLYDVSPPPEKVEYYRRFNSEFVCVPLVHRFFKKKLTVVCGFYPPGISANTEKHKENYDALMRQLLHPSHQRRILFGDMNTRSDDTFSNDKHVFLLSNDLYNGRSLEYLDVEEYHKKCILCKISYYPHRDDSWLLPTIDRNPRLQQLQAAHNSTEIDRQTIADLERFLSSDRMGFLNEKFGELMEVSNYIESTVTLGQLRTIHSRHSGDAFVEFNKQRFLLKAKSRLEAVLRKWQVDTGVEVGFGEGVGGGGGGGGTLFDQLFGSIVAELTESGGTLRRRDNGTLEELDDYTSRRFRCICVQLVDEVNAMIHAKGLAFMPYTADNFM